MSETTIPGQAPGINNVYSPTVPATPTSSILLDRLNSPDQIVAHSAFTEIVRKYEKRLVSSIVLFGIPRAEAEEVVQEVFFELWMMKGADNKTRGLRQYLFGAVRNRSISLLRRYQLEDSKTIDYYNLLLGAATYVGGEPVWTGIPIDRRALKLELFHTIGRTADENLTRKYLSLFMLYLLDECSVEECCESLGTAKQSVKNRRSVIRARMQDTVRALGYDDTKEF